MPSKIDARLDRARHHPARCARAGGQLRSLRGLRQHRLRLGPGQPRADGLITGKLGAGTSLEDGAAAAATCAHQLIAQLKAACGGDLDRVKRVVKLTGFVNSAPDFTDQPKVVNGAPTSSSTSSATRGRHARSAVGVAALPLGVAVEVEGVFEIA